MKTYGIPVRAALFCFTCLVLVLPLDVFAQTHSASVTGTITSKSDGTPVADVDVVATNQATQVTYPAKTNSEGLYTIAALPIGTYKVRAQASGMQPQETNVIQ